MPRLKGHPLRLRRTRTYEPRWEKFELFLEDMGERPEGMTLDRVDTLGHYSKANCRWATRQEQDFNKTNTKIYYADPETRRISGSALEWANWTTRSTGVPFSVDQFQSVMKVMTSEQFFCAFNPLTTYKQLMQRTREEKNRKAAALLEEVDRECEPEYEDTGYVPD